MPSWWPSGRLRSPSSPDLTVRPAAELTAPADRARDAWAHLVAVAMEHRPGAVRVHDGLDRRSPAAALWPMSQVLVAALDVAALAATPAFATIAASDLSGDAGPYVVDADQLVDALYASVATYRSGDGYATHPGGRHRFHDDNAWVGLAAVQAHHQRAGRVAADGWLPMANRALTRVLAGQAADGGIAWEERHGRPSPKNACSTAPGIQLALAVADLDETRADDLVAAATGADSWLRRTLVAPDGLVWDRVEPDGTVDRTVWSYNLGSAVGADLAWWRRTGAPDRLERAHATAVRALDHLAEDDRLWRQPPAFDAIFFRNVLALHAVEAVPGAADALAAYLERVWATARHPRTGRFTGGGIGAYDDGGTLDHAAIVQLFALQAGLAPPSTGGAP